MEVTSTTTKTTTVKPVTPHPLAGGDKVPLTIFDRAAVDNFVPMVLAYGAPAPSNEALKEGLLRAVAPYPHLAGRLAVDEQGRRYLHLNNEGVLVVEADVPADLVHVLAAGAAGGMVTDVGHLYPTQPEEAVGAAVLQVKLSRYRCGGVVIGTISHHHVADGHSMSAFYAAWASAVREGKGFAVPPPFLDRAATAVPRGTPAPAFDHRSIEFGWSYAAISLDKIKNVSAHFTAEFIAELKARVVVDGGGDGRRCSTFQCLLAHVWKKVTAARRLEPEEFTQVRVAVNCRGRATLPVPQNFFGNMVLWAFPRLQARDVLAWSYGGVAGAIRDAVARVDGEYVQSYVDFGGVVDADGEVLVPPAAVGRTLCPDLEVDSWLGFRFHQLDFGTGPPSGFRLSDLPVEGLMIFVPSCTAAAKDGSVDLFVALAKDHAAAFEQICYSLDPLEVGM